MIYFFDTSALQHRYIASDHSRRMRFILSDKRSRCYAASVTTLEIASTFGNHCRRNKLMRAEFRRLDMEFWQDVASGKLLLREPRQNDFLKALHLLEYAGVALRRKITSFDALIAAMALELALETGDVVKFCLADRKLYQIIRDISAYNSVLKFVYIGPDPK